MSVPDYQLLMRPILKAIADGKECSLSICADRIAKDLNLTTQDMEELLPSARQTVLYNRVGWSKFYMSKAGLIEVTKRGFFKITERGITVLKSNPEKVDNTVLIKFKEFADWKQKSSETELDAKSSNDSEKTSKNPEELIERSHATLTAALRSEVLDNVLQLSPSFFERLIIDLLLAMGYGGGRLEMGKSLGKSGDGGVDGVIKEDELGLDLIYVQAKRYEPGNTIGRPAIQGFSGSLDGFNASKGIFVTTSTFAQTAVDYTEKVSKRIILIDGNRLADLMIKHNVGVRIKNVFEIKKIDEDYFVE